MRLLGLLVLPLAAQAGEPLPAPRLQAAFGGFTQPVALRHAGDDRLFVVEQGGAIRVIAGGQVLPTPLLQLTGEGGSAPPLGFSGGGERGLLGLAFAPDFASSGRFYVHYNDARGDTAIVRYRLAAGEANRADPASAEVVLRIDQDFGNHNGGDLHFGPDGLLYIAMGDGGSGNDPCNRAQTLEIGQLQGANSGGSSNDCAADDGFLGSGGRADSRALLGKMLRIDVSQNGAAGDERCGLAAGSAGYAIPPDNPFAAADGICDEVYASGLRNPWRFSFDRTNGDLWIGDVGQNAREEVNLLPAGQPALNFGWRCREGLIDTAGTECSNPPAFTEPVLDYPHSLGESITGGFRYRGPEARLQGMYLFADFISGRHFLFDPGNPGAGAPVWGHTGSPSSFGEAADGTLYVVHYGGCIHRISAERISASGFEDPPC